MHFWIFEKNNDYFWDCFVQQMAETQYNLRLFNGKSHWIDVTG